MLLIMCSVIMYPYNGKIDVFKRKSHLSWNKTAKNRIMQLFFFQSLCVENFLSLMEAEIFFYAKENKQVQDPPVSRHYNKFLHH